MIQPWRMQGRPRSQSGAPGRVQPETESGDVHVQNCTYIKSVSKKIAYHSSALSGFLIMNFLCSYCHMGVSWENLWFPRFSLKPIHWKIVFFVGQLDASDIILVAAQGYTRPAASLRPAVPMGCRPFVAWHVLMIGIWCDGFLMFYFIVMLLFLQILTLKRFWDTSGFRLVWWKHVLLRCLASRRSQRLRSGMVWDADEVWQKPSANIVCVCVGFIHVNVHGLIWYGDIWCDFCDLQRSIKKLHDILYCMTWIEMDTVLYEFCASQSRWTKRIPEV